MTDACGRAIRYLRISVTDRCNLRCGYCMPAQGVPCLPRDAVLRFDEIVRICRCMPRLGISRIKLTGGEPLCRPDLPALAHALAQIRGISEITLTTNGTLLAGQAAALRAAGIRSVNISMDSLRAARYRQLTRRDELEQALAGIHAAQAQQMQVKLNMVPMLGCNDDEILDFLRFASEIDVIVRFIGLMPIGMGDPSRGLSAEELLWQIAAAYPGVNPIRESFGNGPAAYYRLPNGTVFGIIDAVHHRFCGACNRVRLSADGQLYPCLAHPNRLDVRALLHGGADDDALTQALYQTISAKPTGHLFGKTRTDDRMMSQIGG